MTDETSNPTQTEDWVMVRISALDEIAKIADYQAEGFYEEAREAYATGEKSREQDAMRLLNTFNSIGNKVNAILRSTAPTISPRARPLLDCVVLSDHAVSVNLPGFGGYAWMADDNSIAAEVMREFARRLASLSPRGRGAEDVEALAVRLAEAVHPVPGAASWPYLSEHDREGWRMVAREALDALAAPRGRGEGLEKMAERAARIIAAKWETNDAGKIEFNPCYSPSKIDRARADAILAAVAPVSETAPAPLPPPGPDDFRDALAELVSLQHEADAIGKQAGWADRWEKAMAQADELTRVEP